MTEDPILPLMHAIVRGIDESEAERKRSLPEDWESFSLVVGLQDGRYSESYGYAYGADGWVKPVAVWSTAIENELDPFLEDRYPDGQKRPVKVLFQLRLADGSYDVVFEDSDRSRWKVSPVNFREIQQELRPVFD